MIDKLIELLGSNFSITVIFGLFLILVGLSFWGARRMESD